MASRDINKRPPSDLAPSKQYDLFINFFGDPKDLSNTIELWDAIPKYAVSARQQNALRDDRGRLPVQVLEFDYAGQAMDRPARCKLKIRPALIEVEEGVFKDFYPSQSEEIIEEVLKKIFTDQQYGMHSPKEHESWVLFTLHMIRRELRERGHTRSLDEIKRSLQIMATTIIEVEMEGRGRGVLYTNPILSNMARTTRADIEEDPSAKWAAQLPALISKGIDKLAYRQFNYALHMRLSSPLARWLHKRFVHRYRQAHITTPYKFLYSSVARDSGLLTHKRMSSNVKTLDDALEALKAEGVLFMVKAEKRFAGRKLEDVAYEVTATHEFTSEVKAASARLNEASQKIARSR